MLCLFYHLPLPTVPPFLFLAVSVCVWASKMELYVMARTYITALYLKVRNFYLNYVFNNFQECYFVDLFEIRFFSFKVPSYCFPDGLWMDKLFVRSGSSL